MVEQAQKSLPGETSQRGSHPFREQFPWRDINSSTNLNENMAIVLSIRLLEQCRKWPCDKQLSRYDILFEMKLTWSQCGRQSPLAGGLAILGEFPNQSMLFQFDLACTPKYVSPLNLPLLKYFTSNDPSSTNSKQGFLPSVSTICLILVGHNYCFLHVFDDAAN